MKSDKKKKGVQNFEVRNGTTKGEVVQHSLEAIFGVFRQMLLGCCCSWSVKEEEGQGGMCVSVEYWLRAKLERGEERQRGG